MEQIHEQAILNLKLNQVNNDGLVLLTKSEKINSTHLSTKIIFSIV